MPVHSRALSGACLLLVLLPCPALPCSLCVNIRQTPSFRQEASHPGTKLILHGILANPRLGGVAGAGTTDFHILEVLGSAPSLPPALQKRKGDVLILQTYLPVEDPKA